MRKFQIEVEKPGPHKFDLRTFAYNNSYSLISNLRQGETSLNAAFDALYSLMAEINQQ